MEAYHGGKIFWTMHAGLLPRLRFRTTSMAEGLRVRIHLPPAVSHTKPIIMTGVEPSSLAIRLNRPVNKYLPPRPGRMAQRAQVDDLDDRAARANDVPPSANGCCAGSTGCCRAKGTGHARR